MGTTSPRGYRWPETTDRVNQGALAIRQLAEDVDDDVAALWDRALAAKVWQGSRALTEAGAVSSEINVVDVSVPTVGGAFYLVHGIALLGIDATGSVAVDIDVDGADAVQRVFGLTVGSGTVPAPSSTLTAVPVLGLYQAPSSVTRTFSITAQRTGSRLTAGQASAIIVQRVTL